VEAPVPAYSTYTVRRGDTLSRIAQRNGVPIAALIELNDLVHPDRIRTGAVLRLRALSEPLTRQDGAESPLAAELRLGQLSSKYECARGGCGTCSTGRGDRGGVSYGTYQLASNLNRPAEFLAQEGKRWADRFSGQVQGTPQFTATWKAVAAEDPASFEAAQHAYIERTHYRVQLDHVRSETGVDLSGSSAALRNVIWSTAVQHGPGSGIVSKALQSLPLRPGDAGFDDALIKAIYAERGRVDANGGLVHFSRNSAAVQAGIAARFKGELRDALDMLAAEKAKCAIVNTAGMSEPKPDSDDSLLERAATRLTDDDVARLIERYGDHEAVNHFMSGMKVAIALRKSTNTREHQDGAFDDVIMLVCRAADGTVSVKRFAGNTEPCGRYAFDGPRASHGSSIDLNKDGIKDLGRLVPGTYHYQRMNEQFLGAPYFKARGIQVCVRDTNHDGWFDPRDGARLDPGGAGRTMYIHQGGEESTWSAGCQTIRKSDYARFLQALGTQASLSYILIDTD
jgi:LysM repeat protein